MSIQSPEKHPIVLVSGSPRRRSLLELAGFTVDVRPSHADETLCSELALGAAAVAIAQKKLDASDQSLRAAIRVAADTLVALDHEILGKPKDPGEARAMIASLSGRVHRVVTGFVVARAEQQIAEAVVTEVSFRTLTAAEIDAYVARGESLDKAGGYAIQGDGSILVDQVTGSLTNVIGLPMTEVLRAIEHLAPTGLRN